MNSAPFNAAPFNVSTAAAAGSRFAVGPGVVRDLTTAGAIVDLTPAASPFAAAGVVRDVKTNGFAATASGRIVEVA